MHVKGVALLLEGCMKEFSVWTQLIIDGWNVKGTCWKRMASNPGLNVTISRRIKIAWPSSREQQLAFFY